MKRENAWVLGFDKITGKREEFVCCPKSNATFYAEVYHAKGYDVKILTGEEVDTLIEKEQGCSGQNM